MNENSKSDSAQVSGEASTARDDHTPGPWRVEPYELETLDFAISPGGVLTDWDITTAKGEFITVIQHPFNGQRTEANARLIAAAPDLYDAAEMAINTLIGCCVSAGGVDDRATILLTQKMLRAAIAKAQGEQA